MVTEVSVSKPLNVRLACFIVWGVTEASMTSPIERFEEAKKLLLKTLPVARRFLGESDDLTLTMRWIYAAALCDDTGATLDDLSEAVTTLEDTERIMRRVLGGAHPDALQIEGALRQARAALRAREEAATDDVSSVCERMSKVTWGDA